MDIALLQPIVGTILTVTVGWLSTRVSKVLDNQNAQNTSIAVIQNSLNSLTSQVNSLSDWRTRIQEDQIKQLKEEVQKLQGA